MAGKVKELDGKNFDNFIKDGNCVIDFYADWCGPCKIMAPEFEKASKELAGVRFGKVNVDGNQDVAGRFQVMAIPTVIFFKGKEQVDRNSGPLSFDEIKKRVGKVF